MRETNWLLASSEKSPRECTRTSPSVASSDRQVIVRSEFVRDFRPLQAAGFQPCAGALRGAPDQRFRLREVVGRCLDRAEWRHHDDLGLLAPAYHVDHELARNQQRERMEDHRQYA